MGHLGSPGVDFEGSWAPFWGLQGSLGHLGGTLSPQGCPKIAQSLILAPFRTHVGTILEIKIESKSKSFLIDFSIDFLLILGAIWELFGIICWLFVDVFCDDVKTRTMSRRVGESTKMEGCEG